MPGLSRKRKRRRERGVLEDEVRENLGIVFLYERKQATRSRRAICTLVVDGGLQEIDLCGEEVQTLTESARDERDGYCSSSF